MTDTLLILGGAWHYRLDHMIARSTFGEVWQATWLQTGRQVAIKTVNPAHLAAATESLRREIRLLEKTGNYDLIRWLKHGEVDGLPVLVLERLHHSLADELKLRGPRLPLREALDLTGQVAGSLAWLHRHGLCHLDIKPPNLLFTPPGPLQRLKLADFGVSLAMEDGNEHRIPGSLGWLAPEQVFPARIDADGQPCYRSDARTDVYGLGLLLFYLLTGKSTEFADTVKKTLNSAPRPGRDEHRELTQLAQRGLTQQDRARLGSVLGISAPAQDNQEWATENGTLVPQGKPTSRPPADAHPVVDLLLQLLAAAPAQRLPDASAVEERIARLKCP